MKCDGLVDDALEAAMYALAHGDFTRYKLLTEVAYQALDLPKPLFTTPKLESRLWRVRIYVRRGLVERAWEELEEYKREASRLVRLQAALYTLLSTFAACMVARLGLIPFTLFAAIASGFAAWLAWKPVNCCRLRGLRREQVVDLTSRW